MEGWILDEQYNVVGLADVFNSLIWTDRYLGYGDFEILIPYEHATLYPMVRDQYLTIQSSDRYMIIETLELAIDTDGAKITASGRSLESILERRVIWGNKTLTGNLQNGIETLLNENLISPSIAARKIPNFTFKRSTDEYITSREIDVQFVGDNLYDAVYALCADHRIGFRVLPSGAGGFEFELYRGVNHSFDQKDRPFVIFSSTFENLLSSNYLESSRIMKTAALVGGEGEGRNRVFVEVPGTAEGLQRKEIFVEASDITSNDGEIIDRVYKAQLTAKGTEKLAETNITSSFEGEIEAKRQFVYGTDFVIGDIVQVLNEFGMEAKCRVSELIQSHDAEGEAYYPTFTSVTDDEE